MFRERNIDRLHRNTCNGRKYDDSLVTFSDIQSDLSYIHSVLIASMMDVYIMLIIMVHMIMMMTIAMLTMSVTVVIFCFSDIEKLKHT